MKVLKREPATNTVKVLPQVIGDLYHLAQLVEPGDEVRATTWRTPAVDEQVERRGKPEKKAMTLTIRVETVEFQDFSDRLRVAGIIIEGRQDHGMHHTINVEADGKHDLSLRKTQGWRQHHWKRLKQAEKESQQPLVWAIAIEEDEATIAEVQAYGIREVSTLSSHGHGKMYTNKDKGDLLEETAQRIITVRDPKAPLIVVGPGWKRERFIDHLKKEHPSHGKHLYTEGTGQAGMPGVHEAVKRGMLERIVQDHAVARDTRLIERLMAEIAKGKGLATYGPLETHQALETGAVETLLVTDKLVREKTHDALLQLAENVGAEVHVVAQANEAGKQLEGLGGLAAVLRFPLPSEQ
jgi:protein pelota